MRWYLTAGFEHRAGLELADQAALDLLPRRLVVGIVIAARRLAAWRRRVASSSSSISDVQPSPRCRSMRTRSPVSQQREAAAAPPLRARR